MINERRTVIIKSIRVQNFRCLKDVTLHCDPLTVLVGQNGAGKSCLIKALNLFYDPNANYDESDFYGSKPEEKDNISITVSFTKLTASEKKIFHDYIFGDDLIIEKRISFPPSKRSQKYFGWRLKNPDFEAFRQAKGRSELTKAYSDLKKNEKYNSFPSYTNKEEVEISLRAWEVSHPDQCEKSQDEGQFFGFKEVGESRLERFTRFIQVPAVQDAAEESKETKGSVFSDIFDLVVRSTLASKPEFIKFQESIQKEYGDVLSPANIAELRDLSKRLTTTLRSFVPDAEVNISWEAQIGLELPFPPANVRLLEDGYLSPVNCTGHGLQRAFILTMLQHLAYAEAAQVAQAVEPGQPTEVKEEKLPLPNLILGIEEPEIYQHPDRIRHFAKTLLKLSEGKVTGVSESIQIIYCTHSPLLVGTERFDQIRIFRKVNAGNGLPKQTKITSTSLNDVAKFIENACSQPEGTFTGGTLRQRLHAVMTPQMNEGFFSKLVVLVEGIKDRALILGYALALGHDLESMGTSVIYCNGKRNEDRPLAIFKCLKIPVYAVWDADIGNQEAIRFNHEMCRLLEHDPEDYPQKICSDFACVKTNLENVLREEIGEDLFNKTLQDYCAKYELGEGKYALENPTIVADLVSLLHAVGARSETVKCIVREITAKV